MPYHHGSLKEDLLAAAAQGYRLLAGRLGRVAGDLPPSAATSPLDHAASRLPPSRLDRPEQVVTGAQRDARPASGPRRDERAFAGWRATWPFVPPPGGV